MSANAVSFTRAGEPERMGRLPETFEKHHFVWRFVTEQGFESLA